MRLFSTSLSAFFLTFFLGGCVLVDRSDDSAPVGSQNWTERKASTACRGRGAKCMSRAAADSDQLTK